MFFEKVIYRDFYNSTIEYGFINGSNKILLIKAGLTGSLYGYENKYYKIAERINKLFGYTVICSSNPICDNDNPLIDAIEVIKEYSQKMNFKNYEIYYMGNSHAAMLGARYGYKYPEIKKMLLVNAPLFKNGDLLVKGVKNFTGDKVVIIYGSYDPSIRYVDLFSLIRSEALKIHIIEGADHNFSDYMDEFIALPEEFLFNK